jgi:hypothetical protein
MRFLGIDVGSEAITVVDLLEDDAGALSVENDFDWALQTGERPSAYAVLYQQIFDYCTEHRIAGAGLKESTVSLGGNKKTHLATAEMRGLAITACATAGADVRVIGKAAISRTFGDRSADEYLKDNSFWKKQASGQLRKGSRMAALLVLAAHELKK